STRWLDGGRPKAGWGQRASPREILPMTMLQHAVLLLLLPLASAALIGVFLRRAGALAAAISVLASVGIAALAFILAAHGERFEQAWPWLHFGAPAPAGWTLSIGIKLDDLAALMLCIVGVVGLCVHVFSLAYMGHDGAKARYFGGLSI